MTSAAAAQRVACAVLNGSCRVDLYPDMTARFCAVSQTEARAGWRASRREILGAIVWADRVEVYHPVLGSAELDPMDALDALDAAAVQQDDKP